MKSGYQTSTFALAGSLALVSLWRNQHIQHVWLLLAANQGNWNQEDLKPIGLDLLGVAILVFIAGLSPDAGKMAIAVAVGLWLIFLMHGTHPAASTIVQSGIARASGTIVHGT